jgi:CRISPR-associated protein (TIGR03984 family)
MREVLIWRDEDGFRGRELVDSAVEAADPLRPQDQEYVLLGDRLLAAAREGFTLVGDARGSRHAVPLACADTIFAAGPRWPLRLDVRHYFTTDPRSGLVRVAASRLVHVKQLST